MMCSGHGSRRRVAFQPLRTSVNGACDDSGCCILACGLRKLTGARPQLVHFLESPAALVRGAAAVTLIRLGWGIGISGVSEAALLLLEQVRWPSPALNGLP